MAHRHSVQARARGGKALGKFYTGAGSRVEKEAKSEKETFATGGGVSLAKAHGGAAKKRGDRRARGGAVAFKEGGKVWSKAAGGLRGQKAFAGVIKEEKTDTHGEKLDHTAHGGGTEGKNHRVSHKGKAEHQYAKGGSVSAKAKGGKVRNEDLEEVREDENPEDSGDDVDADERKRGGAARHKKLKMHPWGGHSRGHKD